MDSIKKISAMYLEDNDNRADYQSFAQDKNIQLLESVICHWAKAQGFDSLTSQNVACYIVSMALDEFFPDDESISE